METTSKKVTQRSIEASAAWIARGKQEHHYGDAAQAVFSDVCDLALWVTAQQHSVMSSGAAVTAVKAELDKVLKNDGDFVHHSAVNISALMSNDHDEHRLLTPVANALVHLASCGMLNIIHRRKTFWEEYSHEHGPFSYEMDDLTRLRVVAQQYQG